jgi:hypothetical protein
MSILPRPAFPVYDLVIPSLKKKIKFRPYLAKEEKVLSIAMESEDITEIGNAIKLVLENCIMTKDVEIDKLATFDIEYLFLNIRAKAVGEDIELKVLYPDEDEELYVDVKLNINDIKVQETKGHTKTIKLDDEMSMIMRYPSFEYFIEEQFEMPTTDRDKLEKGLDLTASCVDKICKGEDVWTAEDVGKEEVLSFIGDLTSKQFELIQKFLDTMPQLRHVIKVQHPSRTVEVDGEEVPEEKEVILRGIVDFFI